MHTVTQPQPHAIASGSLNRRKQKWLFSLSCGAVLLWTIESGVFAPVSLGQTSLSVPKTEKSPVQKRLSTQSSASSSNPENLSSVNHPLPSLDRTNAAQFNLYRLDTGDGLNINVPQFAEFSTAATIDGEGNAILPIIGRISLTGLTLAEAEQKISYELSTRFLQNRPEVFITLTAPRPAQITLLGEVVKPGFYAFVSGSPLTVALQAAGGSTQRADLRSVMLRRSLADGNVIEEEVDLYTPLISGKALPDVRLQGGDTIIVPKLEVGQDRDYDRALVARTTLPQQTIVIRLVAPTPQGGTALRNLNLPNGSTFLDAIASLPAGDGLLIRVEEIALMRFDPERGKVITQQLNTKKALNGDIAQNIPLQDEDVIIVSRTLIGKAFNFFNVITRPIRDILGFRAFFDFIFNN
ncbi:polysaccharide export protein [Pleurocapsales cyanobacterium LEGE 06147]|nr:polysaccharide export protein [Pleurocapsales cyanobacterium LEGE 06147]